MKQWALLGVIAITGYAAYKWWQNAKHSPVYVGAQQPQPGDMINANLVYSGVPSFDDTSAPSGHGDAMAAAQYDNELATMPGGYNYTPAFGPQQDQGVQTF